MFLTLQEFLSHNLIRRIFLNLNLSENFKMNVARSLSANSTAGSQLLKLITSSDFTPTLVSLSLYSIMLAKFLLTLSFLLFCFFTKGIWDKTYNKFLQKIEAVCWANLGWSFNLCVQWFYFVRSCSFWNWWQVYKVPFRNNQWHGLPYGLHFKYINFHIH